MNTLTSPCLHAWNPMENSMAMAMPGRRSVSDGCYHNSALVKPKFGLSSKSKDIQCRLKGLHLRVKEFSGRDNAGRWRKHSAVQGVNGTVASQYTPAYASNETPRTFYYHLPELVQQDLKSLTEKIKQASSEENPLFTAAADQIFGASGDKIRPALVFLVSRATAELTGLGDITSQHHRLAEIIDLIHTASSMHSDVQNGSTSSLGNNGASRSLGTKVAVLAGDYIFAQTTWLLATLENIEVIKLISQVVKDISIGEITQTANLYNCEVSLEEYLQRIYCKTASLIAASAKSAAVFSGANAEVKEKMYDYGKNLGLALQIVNDTLDLTNSDGKLAGSVLKKGNLTVPVIYALETEPSLKHLIQAKFLNAEDLDRAIKIVQESGGIERAIILAKEKAKIALNCLDCLTEGALKSSLQSMVDYVLDHPN